MDKPDGCNRRGSPFSKGGCVFLLMLGASLRSTHGADIVWTNINGGLWSAATNWSPNTVPGAADNAYITNSGVYAVTVDVSATIASFRAGGGGGTQTVVVGSTMLAVNGTS